MYLCLLKSIGLVVKSLGCLYKILCSNFIITIVHKIIGKIRGRWKWKRDYKWRRLEEYREGGNADEVGNIRASYWHFKWEYGG